MNQNQRKPETYTVKRLLKLIQKTGAMKLIKKALSSMINSERNINKMVIHSLK